MKRREESLFRGRFGDVVERPCFDRAHHEVNRLLRREQHDRNRGGHRAEFGDLLNSVNAS